MVIENIRPGCLEEVYQRFHKNGRMLPNGLSYVDSWLEKSGRRCFQLMESENSELFAAWIERWADLIDFDVVELGEKSEKEN